MAIFDNLCETFPDDNCVLITREILEVNNTCVLGVSARVGQCVLGEIPVQLLF